MKTRLNTGFDAIDGCFSRRFVYCGFCGFGGAQFGNLFLFGFVVRIFSAGDFVLVFSVYIHHFPTLGMRPSNL